MIRRVLPEYVSKGKTVSLCMILPTDRMFGNKYPVNEGTRGYVKSNGFENGRLKVEFYTSLYGTQYVEFNELSAKEYLYTDV